MPPRDADGWRVRDTQFDTARGSFDDFLRAEDDASARLVSPKSPAGGLGEVSPSAGFGA